MAGKMSLKVKGNRTPKGPKQNKKWFDKTCYEARKELKNLRYLLIHNPKNPSIRGSYFKKKKEFNKLVRTRKRQHENDCLLRLQNLQENNPTPSGTYSKN